MDAEAPSLISTPPRRAIPQSHAGAPAVLIDEDDAGRLQGTPCRARGPPVDSVDKLATAKWTHFMPAPWPHFAPPLTSTAWRARWWVAQRGTVHSSLTLRPIARGTPADQAGGTYDAARVLGVSHTALGARGSFLGNNPKQSSLPRVFP